MLGLFMRNSLHLVNLPFGGISEAVSVEKLERVLQECSELTEFRFSSENIVHGLRRSQSVRNLSDRMSTRALGSLIRGLAFPHSRLNSLYFCVCFRDSPEKGWTLLETGRENPSPQPTVSHFGSPRLQ